MQSVVNIPQSGVYCFGRSNLIGPVGMAGQLQFGGLGFGGLGFSIGGSSRGGRGGGCRGGGHREDGHVGHTGHTGHIGQGGGGGHDIGGRQTGQGGGREHTGHSEDVVFSPNLSLIISWSSGTFSICSIKSIGGLGVDNGFNISLIWFVSKGMISFRSSSARSSSVGQGHSHLLFAGGGLQWS